MHLICELQVFSGLITNCNHNLSSRWFHVNTATSGCGAKQAFQRHNETELNGLDVCRRQEADKRWQHEETQPIHCDPAEMVKKSFLKTGISNRMGGNVAGESPPSEEEPDGTWDTDERLTQHTWKDLFGESDDELLWSLCDSLWWTITSVLPIYNDVYIDEE